jgi:ABC-type transport system involved in multi-copper enzyme maturation permease subunit
MKLLGVELTRLRWRRAVVLLLLLAVVVPALIGATRIWSTRPVSESEIAAVTRSNADQIADCVDHPRRYGMPKGATQTATEGACTDQIIGWYTGREKMSLSSERNGAGMGVVAVLTALLLLAGTTFVGHDWNSGSMSNQLLFDPRRGRVWTAKALVVTLVALVIAVVVSTSYWLGMFATMRIRDLTVLDGSLADSLAYGLRGAGFAAAAALGGYALTMLFRSTVATIGVLFGVAVAGGIVIAALGIGENWQPQTNVAAIVKNGTFYYADLPQSCFAGASPQNRMTDGSECDPLRELSLWDGVGYYGAALVLTMGASVVSFRRRDVP